MKDVFGKKIKLEISRVSDYGMYLKYNTSEILLPNKYCTLDMQEGDLIEVFIYKDSMDRPIATTLEPKILLNQIKPLIVKDIIKMGAFLDWGLEKDLFVPRSYLPEWIEKDKPLFVKLVLDNASERLIGEPRIWKELTVADENIKIGDIYTATVYGETDLGFRVMLNNQYDAFIYKNGGVDKELTIGDNVEVVISYIRDDKKINIILKKWGKDFNLNSKNIILDKLKESENNFLPFGDFSTPEEIKKEFGLSKKKFKQFIGNLYSSKLIEIKKDGIYLIRK